MSRRVLAALGILVGALAPATATLTATTRAAGALPAAVPFDLGRAAAFLRSQQQPDGGFETAGFPGFETPDAVLALAEVAQTGPVWDQAQARAAVGAVVRDGRSPLDYLDDLAETSTSAGQAAKLIVLVTGPLGFPANAFDPQGDGPVNLVARVDGARNANGSYGPPGALNATLYAAISRSAIANPGSRDFILGAQQANGGWNFAGDPSGDEVDVDTTGLAVQALMATGVDPYSAPVRRALAFLEANQLPSGGWAAFGQEDPNATALALLAFTATGERIETCRLPARNALASRQAADGRVASPNDAFGVNTFATSQAVQALSHRWLPIARRPSYCPDDGFRLVAADGGVFAFGAPFFGSTGALRLNRPMVGVAATPSGQGYWLVAADGGVFGFGDAAFLGSMGGTTLNQPVVAVAATPTGKGYWLVARDGGVFAFGDATFLGSMGGTPLNRPIVGMAATPTGKGYRLVAADGGVFAFGDARFLGSMGGTPLNEAVVALAGTPSGKGYWMLARDGGVFAFGDATYLGRVAPNQALPDAQAFVGLRSLVRDEGYLPATADGKVWRFPGATAATPAEPLRLSAPIVGITG